MARGKKTLQLIKKRRGLQQWRGTQLCADCGTHKDLTLHHINHKSDGGKAVKNNLIVLCRKCHNEEHKRESKEKNKRFWAEGEIYDLMELKKCGYTYDELADMFGKPKLACQTMIHSIKLGGNKASIN